MVYRVAFFLMMVCALVGFGTVAWVALRQPPPAPAPVAQLPPPIPVAAAPAAPAAPAPVQPVVVQKKFLVASRSIATGAMLKPEDIVGRPLASEVPGAIAADSADAIRLLAGSMSKHIIAAGEAIREDDVLKPTDHGFMAAALGQGMRAVTIGVDATSGSAGLVWPGDRVDLTLTQTLTDPALPIGRRVSAETILTDSRVIAIDQQLMQGAAPTGSGDGQGRTVTLEVQPEDVQRVSVAMRLGRRSLSVRAVSADDAASAGSGSPGSAAAKPRGGSIFARDVSSALGIEVPVPAEQRVIRVFHGSADPKEFKY
ncbi:MAG: Flp pilus assembly protein CpaB [Rhodospirillales bacterium]